MPSAQTVRDGFLSLVGGMNGGYDPALLQDGTYAKGINVTCRDGIISTRPSWSLYYEMGKGKFQGASRWSLNSGDRIVYVIDGVIYSLELDSKKVINHGLRMDPTVTRCSFVQVDRWMMIQDGVSYPFVIEENKTTYTAQDYSGTNPAVPAITPGYASAYIHGRIHYSPAKLPLMTPTLPTIPTDADYNAKPTISTEVGRQSIVSSDVIDLYSPEFVFRLSEHRVLNEGGAIGLPSEVGFIYAIAPFRNSTTGTGLGAAVVFGRDGVCAFDFSIPRTQWSETNITQVLFFGNGTVSPMSVVPVNDDLMYVDTTGNLRTVKYTASSTSGSGGSLSSTPLSFELRPFIEQSAREALPATSLSFSDNRVLFTTAGLVDGNYRALGVLDTAKAASISGAENPSYDGVWTGYNYLQVLSARKNKEWLTFIVVKDLSASDSVSLLWLDSSANTDCSKVPVKSVIWTRMFEFNSPSDTKKLILAELWLSDIKRNTDVSVYFRPRGYHKWSLAATKTIVVPEGSQPQTRRRLHFPVPMTATGCNPASNEKLYLATSMQFAIVFTGRCKVDRFLATATLVLDPPAACVEEKSVVVDGSAPGIVLEDFDFAVTI